jgi:hypothetical protein
MDQNTIIHLVPALLICLLVITGSSNYGLLQLAVVTLAFIAAGIILTLAFADFLVFPTITRLLGINIIPFKNYIIPRDQDATVKYVNNMYYATGYIAANIYNYVFAAESIQEDNDALVLAPEKWEKATMNIHFPFKFHLISAAEEIQNFREELETKRGLYEFQYSRETTATTPNPMGLEALQRQIRVVQARIDRLGSGEKPVNSIMYIESTAVGVSDKDARDSLTKQMTELTTVFNVFDLSLSRVYGRELYLLQKMNYVIPTLNELKDQFQQQA